MPFFNSRAVLEIAQGIKAFWNVEAGVTRGRVPSSEGSGDGSRADSSAENVDPSKIVWIFGMARTGSTWLGHMMGDLNRHRLFDEPRVGSLFGDFHYVTAAHKKGQNSMFGFSPERRRSLIRGFVLMAVDARFSGLTSDEYIVVKEPNGSVGAPLLVEALPESAMIFLIRDPRDVVSSSLSGKSEGGWNRMKYDTGVKKIPIPLDPDDIVRATSDRYLNLISRSKEAYESHEGPKTLVRYEDLRADTLGTMKRIYSDLRISVSDASLEKVVKKHDWENIPSDKKGHGKRNRKAMPGGWREDLTPEQARRVEKITAPIFREFYS